MAVTIGRTLVTPWTWDTYPGKWEDEATADKPWTEAGVMSFAFGNTEAAGISEGRRIYQAFGLFMAESLGFSEAVVKRVTAAKFEASVISEGFQSNSNSVIRASETLGISEGNAYTVSQALEEAFSVADELAKQFTFADEEAFAVGDAMSRTASFLRGWLEGVVVADTIAKTGKLGKVEATQLLDYFIRNANGVIGDISFFTTAYGLAEFEAQAKAAPTGFTEFVPFLAGEHTFREAIFKTTLEAATTMTRPRLSGLVAAVDVPDVTEQGVVTVQVGGTHVTYAKKFFKAPSVKVTIKAGVALCIPRISNETETGFDLKLESLANPGTFISGVATWSSEGY